MAKNVNEIMKGVPVSRRKKTKARAALLIAEARELTQEKLAKSLGVNQKQLSAIEKRTDMHLSTLRRTVEKTGGRLTLVVEFPDREPVTLAGAATTEPESTPPDIRSAARARGQSLRHDFGSCWAVMDSTQTQARESSSR